MIADVDRCARLTMQLPPGGACVPPAPPEKSPKALAFSAFTGGAGLPGGDMRDLFGSLFFGSFFEIWRNSQFCVCGIAKRTTFRTEIVSVSFCQNPSSGWFRNQLPIGPSLGMGYTSKSQCKIYELSYTFETFFFRV